MAKIVYKGVVVESQQGISKKGKPYHMVNVALIEPEIGIVKAFIREGAVGYGEARIGSVIDVSVERQSSFGEAWIEVVGIDHKTKVSFIAIK